MELLQGRGVDQGRSKVDGMLWAGNNLGKWNASPPGRRNKNPRPSPWPGLSLPLSQSTPEGHTNIQTECSAGVESTAQRRPRIDR
jgi:hypothetical protein